MTRDELSKCHGFLVMLTVDGKHSMAHLDASNPSKAYLGISKLGAFNPVHAYELTDEDVATMQQRSPREILSRISLQIEDGQASA